MQSRATGLLIMIEAFFAESGGQLSGQDQNLSISCIAATHPLSTLLYTNCAWPRNMQLERLDLSCSSAGPARHRSMDARDTFCINSDIMRAPQSIICNCVQWACNRRHVHSIQSGIINSVFGSIAQRESLACYCIRSGRTNHFGICRREAFHVRVAYRHVQYELHIDMSNEHI